MKKITEKESLYHDLEKMSSSEIIQSINQEDAKVHEAVGAILDDISQFVDEAFTRMSEGGRLFYIGAGTSGRLGILDASECPPTFGVSHNLVIGLIAGGDQAIRKAVEFAEDDRNQAWKDLEAYQIGTSDILVGIAASGTTPYVLGGIEKANQEGILTAGISCNPESPLSQLAQHNLCPVVGPEFLTGSTRMKSGTAQKMVLNMISTSLMIKLGHVQGNRMVDMQLSNDKLVDRGVRMIQEKLDLDYETAKKELLKYGSVREVLKTHQS
ncbi:MAG: N-acetylmuramic acid 6-phosphate etherase [Bacteroidetes bacterium]|nr:MAG: N-acetylmuramic acid 6-phosphate etherase [Bacteroidota bacterium]